MRPRINQRQDNDPVLRDFLSRIENDPAFAARIDAALAKGEADIDSGRTTRSAMLTPAVIRRRIADNA